MYTDFNRKYQVFDFQMSHNELLLRSSKYKELGLNKNIDILFKGVMSLNIVTTFNGIEIIAVEKMTTQTCKVFPDVSPFMFKLKDKLGIETYIEAAAFGVFTNELDFGVTSLGDFMWSAENNCIYWSHEDEVFKKRFNIKKE